MELDFEQEIQIDPNALDIEWLKQASLMHHYAAKVAHSREAMELAKNKVELVHAQLNIEIRKNPPEGVKVTESYIESLIEVDPKLVQARQHFEERRKEFNLLQAAVTALDNKKEALTNLVKLNGTNYFSSPSVPRNLDKEWEETQRRKKSNEKIKERMSNRQERKRT